MQDNNMLCACSLLDHAIKNQDNDFFLQQFGRELDSFTLADYDKLASNLSERLKLNVRTRSLILSDVPQHIRVMFEHGAAVDNVYYFYPTARTELRTYKKLCQSSIKCRSNSVALSYRTSQELAQLSRKLSTITPDALIELSQKYKLTIAKLWLEIFGEE